MIKLSLEVNGRTQTGLIAARKHLADFLRDDLNLTGTHLGCEHGVCGACTLMVDGRPMRSCLMLAAACHGAHVRTIEGFDEDALMTRLRQAFARHHALQCGYCTPGMLITAYDIVRRLPGADAARIREELSGNLCRCTGYVGIVAAIVDVLANDPPPAAVQPVRRAAAVTAQGEPAKAMSRRGGSQQDPSFAPATAGAALDGTVLERQIRLAAPADAVWPILQDVHRVAACLPGARIERQDGDTVHGVFAVALGPIKVSFRGQAIVSYARDERAVTVAGSGRDPISRSTAEGVLRCKVAADGPLACVVTAVLTYRLRGPLAQFGRPALVATFVDGVLAIFTRNLAAAAQGQAPGPPAPLGGRTLLQGFIALVKQIFRRA